MSDRQLAKKTGLSFVTIRVWRRKYGIAPLRPLVRVHWHAKDIDRIGKRTDAELARRLNISPAAVRMKRVAMKIPVFDHSNWSKTDDQTLGSGATDNELARRVKRPRRSVAQRRRQLGIPITYEHRRHAWTPAEISLLGTMTDVQLAKRLDCIPAVVAYKRQQLHIPPFIIRTRTEWTSSEARWLGKAPDREIAAKLGRTIFSVSLKRHHLGIPGFRHPRQKPAA